MNDRYADYADVSIDITSVIHYYDGHTEDGPSTEFNSRLRDGDALESLSKLYGRTINKLTSLPFGGRLLWELGQIMVPKDPDTKKKYIIYYVHMYGTAYWEDGSTKSFESNNEYQVPLFNDYITWDLKVE